MNEEQVPTTQLPEEYIAHTATRLDGLVRAFEQHPSQQVREQVLEMLGLVDALHREGIRRLVEVLWSGSPAVLAQALEDPAINVLLQLYDLAPVELTPAEQVELALDSVRPYIESHGGSLEILDVLEGVVHLRLSGACQGCAGSAATLRHGIEAALREGFPGFRSIEVHEPLESPTPARSGGFIPLQQIGTVVRTINRPVFSPVLPIEALPAGTLHGVVVEGIPVLLCNHAGEIYAYRNACPGSDLPLDTGKLQGYVLLCPWHNCVYDVRTGRRLDGGTGRLEVLPVAVRDGMIQLAVNVEPVRL